MMVANMIVIIWSYQVENIVQIDLDTWTIW